MGRCLLAESPTQEGLRVLAHGLFVPVGVCSHLIPLSRSCVIHHSSEIAESVSFLVEGGSTRRTSRLWNELKRHPPTQLEVIPWCWELFQYLSR